MSHGEGLGQPHGASAAALGFYISLLTSPCMWLPGKELSPWKWVAQLCPTLCHPTDCGVHGILQARALEWVAPFSRGASQPRDQTQVSYIAGGFFTSWAPRAAGRGKFFHFRQPLNIWVSSSPSPVSLPRQPATGPLGRCQEESLPRGTWGRVLPPGRPASSSAEGSLLWAGFLAEAGERTVRFYWGTFSHLLGLCSSVDCVYTVAHLGRCAQSLGRVQLLVTLWTSALQAPLSMEFSWQEYWSGLGFLLWGIFPTQRSLLHLLHWKLGSLPLSRLRRTSHQCGCRDKLYSWSPSLSGSGPLAALLTCHSFHLASLVLGSHYSCLYWLRGIMASPTISRGLQRMGFPGGSEGKASACSAGDLGFIPGWGRSPGGGSGTQSSVLAREVPWTEEPGGLQSTGSQRAGHDWATNTHRERALNFVLKVFLAATRHPVPGKALVFLGSHGTELSSVFSRLRECARHCRCWAF